MLQVGDKLIVRHRIKWMKGFPVFVGSPEQEYIITHVYMDGRVQVSGGDVWHVVEGANGRYYSSAGR